MTRDSHNANGFRSFDHSRTNLPHLTTGEQDRLRSAKLRYERGEGGDYLSALLDMRTLSKQRLLNAYRGGDATKPQTVDAIFEHELRSA